MQRVSSSFRDPDSYVFKDDVSVLRRFSYDYLPVFRDFSYSHTFRKLVDYGWVLPFRWIDDCTIRPVEVPFISYPYEWSFSMLKEAALLTLDIMSTCLDEGYVLQDASAYNVQFVKGRPIFIDHGSFYPYKEGQPWVAYKQFCQHFLNPLLLSAYRGPAMLKLLLPNLDGITALRTWSLLPISARLRPSILIHTWINTLEPRSVVGVPTIPRYRLVALLGNLRKLVGSLVWLPASGWKDYEKECNYTSESTHCKAWIVDSYLKKIGKMTLCDLGANVGLYSQVACDSGYRVIAVDSDPSCTELCYKSNNGCDCLPLNIDITNPSPAIGWENLERDSFTSRLDVDVVLALALVHHLAIGNNLPLSSISSFLAGLCKYLVIEWVPKEDSQVTRLLRFREDIFPSYTEKDFKEAFERDFAILDFRKVEDTLRSVYLMEVK